ncbi:MAG: hypothetical protein QOF62_877 [Pyrinomonadaceae bacterium]|jgi:hypothetical protein|nr:hypothetical protein [Pyrinomonadaceae bacterium]
MGSFREKFMRTERNFARHPAAIKERLIDAARHGIAALHSNQHELAKMPEDIRQQFLEYMDDLTKIPGAEGSIHATVSQMSEGEAQIMVDRFLALGYEVKQVGHGKS